MQYFNLSIFIFIVYIFIITYFNLLNNIARSCFIEVSHLADFFTKLKSINNLKLLDMIQKIKKIFQDPLEVGFMVSGLSILGIYYFYIRQKDTKPKIKKNILELNLHQLIKDSQDQKVCKIVLTQSSEFYHEFKNRIITRLTQVLNEFKLQVLFNCSPLKIFRAGTQVFYGTLSKQDNDDQRDMIGYFYNSLKCQLIIQKTIIDIQKIRKSQQKAYLICDNNSLDIKIAGDSAIWQKFLNQAKILESDLKNNYTIVFQIIQNENIIIPNQWKKQLGSNLPNIKQMDQKIIQTWSSFPHFYRIYYKPYMIMEQNVEVAIEYIIDCMRPFFKNKISYQRRRVFVKDW